MEYIPLLIEKLSIDRDIVAIYLFGSYAEGKQTPVSDIDLAVLLDGDFPPNRYFEKKLALLALSTSLLKTDEVDLVIINHAPPAISYRILSKGRLLFEKENGKSQRVNFQVRIYDRYFDLQLILVNTRPSASLVHSTPYGIPDQALEDHLFSRAWTISL